jgi:hypothetical protein
MSTTATFVQDMSRQVDQFEKHSHVLIGLRGLIDSAKQLHAEERQISLLSVRLVGLLVEQNGAGNSMMTQEKFAWHIGLTPNMFWKRAQAFRVLRNHPRLEAMVENGDTCITHVAMLAGKITQANCEILIEGIKRKSTHEVKDLVASVDFDGTVLNPRDAFIDLKVRFNKDQMALLNRAREVLASGAQVPSNEEILTKALESLLYQKDPLIKADRARQKPSSSKKELDQKDCKELDKDTGASIQIAPSLKKEENGPRRSAIPAAVKHQVWRRDNGTCTHQFRDGSFCHSRMMIELDHIVPWARGGEHSVQNLALKCREHNTWSAVQVFGQKFMMDKMKNGFTSKSFH